MAPVIGISQRKTDMTKSHSTRNVRRAVSTVIASVVLILAATASPALASYNSWAG